MWTMIVDYLTALASLFVLLFAMASHPRGATCPAGWWLSTGVRSDGRFACTRKPIGDDHRDARGILVDDSVAPPGELDGHVYCMGTIPVIVSDRAVECRSF